MKATVFVVDDDRAFLRSTTRLFESEEFLVEAFRSGRDFLDSYDVGRPGCLLLDLKMPDISGLEVLSRLRDSGVLLPTIVMTAFGSIQSAVQAMKLGALDFVEKPIHSNSDLLKLVRQTLSTDRRGRTALQEIRRTAQQLRTLTDREREILDRVVDGHSSKEIASEFDLSVATVNTHRVHILEKMEVGSVQNLISLISRYRFSQQRPDSAARPATKRRR